jgi:hypothetical protein
MAFEKGKPRPPNAGRRKGTPNKVTQAAGELALPYCQRAFERLKEIMEQKRHLSSAVKAAELLVAYGYGRPRQVIEHTGADGAPMEFTLELGEAAGRIRGNGGRGGNGGG